MQVKGGNNSRQRMINLMYIVFIALMGLGVHEETSPTAETSEGQGSELRGEDASTAETATQSMGIDTASSDRWSDYPLSARAIVGERNIVKGATYKAEIALVVDVPPERKSIVVQGQELRSSDGLYRLPARSVGTHRYSGHITWRTADGKSLQYPFDETYKVIEPTIAIAPELMNVLYAGIDNRASVSVAGLDSESLILSSQEASVRREGGHWLVKPTTLSKEIQLNVSARQSDGSSLSLGERKLSIRPLPPPSPYLSVGEERGGQTRFRGGRISKAKLLAIPSVSAAVDDGILDLNYDVESFQLISFDGLGNAIPEVSSGKHFSPRQKTQIQNSQRGKRLYITEIVARGADGSVHRLPSLELIVQ